MLILVLYLPLAMPCELCQKILHRNADFSALFTPIHAILKREVACDIVNCKFCIIDNYKNTAFMEPI